MSNSTAELKEIEQFIYAGTTLGEMIKQHDKNALIENQSKTSKDFMNKVMYNVPLNRLYKVLASCQYNEGANYCPVLVKIID